MQLVAYINDIKMKNSIILILLVSMSMFSQQQVINGTIIDSETQNPINGVVVKSISSDDYTQSDFDGKFKINANKDDEFIFMHINYKKITQKLTNNEIIVLKNKPIELDDIIVTANPLEDISHSTTIIDNSKATSQPRNVTDLFKEVNGFGIQKRGAYASEPVFRAFRYEQLNIQYDGASKIMNACPNRMDPITTHVIPEEIEKIELIKGPFTVRFGQNFGGIINIVSKEPNKDKKGIVGSIESGYETNGENIITRAELQYAKNKFDIVVNGSYRNYGDYEDGDGNEIPSAFKTTDYAVKIGYNPTNNQRAKISFRQSFGRDILHAGLPMDSPYDNSHLIGIDYKINPKSKLINYIIFKGFQSEVDHLMSNKKRPNFMMVEAETNVFSKIFGGKIEVSMSPIDNLMLFSGVDANLISRDGDRVRKIKIMNGNVLPNPVTQIDKVWQDSYLNNIGVFSELKYQLENKVTLTFGVRADFSSSGIDDPAIQMTELYGDIDDKNEVNFSGNVAFKKRFKTAQIQLAFGRGTRTASMVERYINHFNVEVDPYEYIGNPNLKAEVNNQIEFSYFKKFKRISIETSVFYSIIEDYITAFVNEDIPRLYMPMLEPRFTKQYINVDEATQSGFEFNFDYKATNNLKFSSSVAYTYAQNKDFKEPLPQIQPLTVNLNSTYKKEKYWLKLNAHFVAKQDRISTSFREEVSNDYATFDFSGGFQPNKNLSFGASVLNIFDKAYYSHLNFSFKNSDLNSGRILETGRNFTVYAKYKF